MIRVTGPIRHQSINPQKIIYSSLSETETKTCFISEISFLPTSKRRRITRKEQDVSKVEGSECRSCERSNRLVSILLISPSGIIIGRNDKCDITGASTQQIQLLPQQVTISWSRDERINKTSRERQHEQTS